jgi:nucleoside-diphosphate-sugar epimerase
MDQGRGDPLDPDPVEGMRDTSAAMTYLDEAVIGAGGIALRYGGFYGADNDGLVWAVRKRQFLIVGSGDGVSSFIHLEDAAAATVLALEHDGPAIYNIVDDEPAPVAALPERRDRVSSRAFLLAVSSEAAAEASREQVQVYADKPLRPVSPHRVGDGSALIDTLRHVTGVAESAHHRIAICSAR